MSHRVGSLHRSISHPVNLQKNLPIIPLFAFPPPQSPHDNTSSSTESDTNSNTTLYNNISQFINSDIETPDKFANSKLSPSTFSQHPFQPTHSQVKIEPASPTSLISYVTPTYSPLTSEPSDNNSSVNTQISHELDNLITFQQQLQHPQTLTIHQLSQSIISPNPSIPTPSSHYTPSQNATSSSIPSSSTNRAYRTSKKNSQILYFLPTQEHPQHLSIIHCTLTQKNFSKSVYPFSPSTHIFTQTPMTKNLIM